MTENQRAAAALRRRIDEALERARIEAAAGVLVRRAPRPELDQGAELRAHRLELAEYLELVRLRFDGGTALGLAVAIRELREWPPIHGVE